MRIVRRAAFAALSSLALIPSIATANGACWRSDEAKAAQLRGLQTMLMVGTLQCRHINRYSIDLYDDFINGQRRILDANAGILKARFIRENGIEGGQGAYDAFATSLANRYSAEMNSPEDCQTVEEFARLAERASHQQLMQLAEAVAEAPDSRACAFSRNGFDKSEVGRPEHARRDLPPPPPRVAVAEAAIRRAPVAPAVTPADTAPAAVEAAAQQAVPALPEEGKEAVIEKAVAAATPAVAPAIVPAAAAQPNKDEALKSAIVALQSAITALQAASAVDPAPALGPALVKVPDAPVVPPQEPSAN